jgi:2-haloacid dehalogenase
MAEPIHAVVFDAYGTLFDVHSVIGRCEQLFPGRGETLSWLWRASSSSTIWLRSLMGRYQDFESVTSAALNCLREPDLPLAPEAARSLLDEYLRLEPYSTCPPRCSTCAEGNSPVCPMARLLCWRRW